MTIKDIVMSPRQQMEKNAFVLSRGEDPVGLEVTRQLRRDRRCESSTSSSHQPRLTCLRVTRDADKVLVILFVC